jgi:predicted RNA-binding protein with PIN domain
VDEPVDARTAAFDEALRGTHRVYVDAMNVIGSRPDGWWRDRDGAVRRLAARLQAFASHQDAEVVLVVDGRPVTGLPDGPNGGILVRYARRSGRDAADDRIVELLGDRSGDLHDPRGGVAVVVTADRELGRRAQSSGAHVVGPRQLLAALDRSADAPS